MSTLLSASSMAMLSSDSSLAVLLTSSSIMFLSLLSVSTLTGLWVAAEPLLSITVPISSLLAASELGITASEVAERMLSSLSLSCLDLGGRLGPVLHGDSAGEGPGTRARISLASV